MNRFQKKSKTHPIFQSQIKTSKRNNGTGWQCFQITSPAVSRSQAGIMGKQAIWGDSCRTRRQWRTLIRSDFLTCCLCIIHFRAWFKNPRKLTWICKMTPYWRGDTVHFNKETFSVFMWWLSLYIYIHISIHIATSCFFTSLESFCMGEKNKPIQINNWPPVSDVWNNPLRQPAWSDLQHQ